MFILDVNNWGIDDYVGSGSDTISNDEDRKFDPDGVTEPEIETELDFND